MNSFAMTPYGTRSNNKHQSHFNPNNNLNQNQYSSNQSFRNRPQPSDPNINLNNPFTSSSANNPQSLHSFNNQENNNYLNNQSFRYNPSKSSTNSLLHGQQNLTNRRSPNKSINNTSTSKSGAISNKYSSLLPKKAMRSSGLADVSPIPHKYTQSKSSRNNSHIITDRERLDISGLNDNNSMPISPIKPNLSNRNNEYAMSNNNTLPLNATINSTHFGATSHFGNESRLSVQQINRDIQNPTQITIIGFPSGIVVIDIFFFLMMLIMYDICYKMKVRHNLFIVNLDRMERF